MDFKTSQRTTDPIVTGTSVLGIKFKDGVMLMADTLGSYGSLARFKDLRRISKVNEHTAIAASGEYSDFQYIERLLESLTIDDFCIDDGSTLGPAEIHSYLGRVLYNRRSKVNPLWNHVITGGFKDGKSFLGMTDLYGSTYQEDILATGFGNFMAVPLMRKAWKPDLSAAEAKKLLEDCMTVLIYRDCYAFNRFTMATVTKDGVNITEPFSLKTHWEFRAFVEPNRKEIGGGQPSISKDITVAGSDRKMRDDEKADSKRQ